MMGPDKQDFDHWMARARKLAERALPDDVPVGAIILDPSGQVAAEGWNLREQQGDITAHAEIIAMRNLSEKTPQWRLDGYTMIVTLEPCPMCASALLQARVSNIVFGAWDPIQGALGSVMQMTQFYPWQGNVLGGIEESSCRNQLQTFFQSLR